MTSEEIQLERLSLELVADVLTQPPESQLEFLLSRTENDPQLRQRALSIFEVNAGRTLPFQTGGALEHSIEGPPPEIVGTYRIEREIGRGGMGAVYLGRHTTTEFDHVAAIKIVRKDAASPRLIERLRVERRTLAKLKHPNIAQMYDGGELPDGAPYFVMEFVEGIPLNKFLSSNDPSLDERLKLFLDICDAVSFAHRNLVIHRDLSPANILISDEGRVKLIDFGIAHSLDEDVPATQSANPQTTMTKGYAAPEQQEGAPASTITDVYALGVVLEEITRDLEAPRRNDLLAITTKAHALSPEERYQSVDAFVADIDAYRRGDAVAAVGAGPAYILARFIGRRKFAVGVGAIAIAATVITSIVMSVLYVRADLAERQAVKRFDEVRELAGFIMFDLHDEVARLEGSTPAREMLIDTALGYLDALSKKPDTSDGLKFEIARGYKRLSDVTGNPSNPNLGRRAEADILLEKAAAQIGELRQTSTDDPAVLRAFVEILDARALQESFSNNDFEIGLALIGEAQDASEMLIASGKAKLTDRSKDAYLNQLHGYMLQKLARYDDALSQTSLALEKYKTLVTEHPDNSELALGNARANITHGETMSWQFDTIGGDHELTLPFFNKGVAGTRELLAAPNPSLEAKIHLIVSLLKRANTTCYLEGRTSEGLADLDEAETFSEKLIAGDRKNSRLVQHLVHIMIQKVECFYNHGSHAKAVSTGIEAIARRDAQLAHQPDNPGLLKDLANTLGVVAAVQVEVGDWVGACTNANRITQTWRRYSEVQSALTGTNSLEQVNNRQLLNKCAERGFSPGASVVEDHHEGLD